MVLLVLGCTDPETLLVIDDQHNFTVSLTVDIPAAAAAESADVVLDWGGLTEDMLGQPFEPAAEQTGAFLVVFQGPDQAEIEAQIAVDALQQSTVGLYVTCRPEAPQCALSEMTVNGTDANVEQYFTEGSGTWLVGVTSTGADDRVTNRRLQFLTPDADSAATTVTMADGEGTFAVDADLTSLTAISAGVPAPILDWSALTVDGTGSPISLHQLDELVITAYDTLSAADVAADFVAAESLADGLWTMDVGGRAGADLAELAGFPGFDAERLWLVGLRCTTCTSPVPRFAGVVRLAE